MKVVGLLNNESIKWLERQYNENKVVEQKKKNSTENENNRIKSKSQIHLKASLRRATNTLVEPHSLFFLQ